MLICRLYIYLKTFNNLYIFKEIKASQVQPKYYYNTYNLIVRLHCGMFLSRVESLCWFTDGHHSVNVSCQLNSLLYILISVNSQLKIFLPPEFLNNNILVFHFCVTLITIWIYCICWHEEPFPRQKTYKNSCHLSSVSHLKWNLDSANFIQQTQQFCINSK